ncbi:flavodoxin domain-containing protein [Iodobacter ciconiae]|uniref:Menaquinone-dependent protoporphyrinogen IX dehydrogenase n=1 Tax=Iodobacter ciconiae TaxID=2496266 RepID=A0A3S8ZS34_9NEIS|nr:flavodoxin domain-containing protein [Iodobacter ciconiae]AZN36225.1 menaquinone-dependent protoporphyrinogen IX dehydrogenase [Iodobacter ciconiae]
MKPILILYASRDGQAERIAQTLALHLNTWPVQLCDLKDPSAQTIPSTAIIVVASVRYGRHLPEAVQFFKRHTQLTQTPLAIASVSLSARKGDGSPNTYLKKLIQQHQLSPIAALSIAGKLDYPRYRWLDKQIIRLIMRITGGPYDGISCVEYTNWPQLTAFAQKITAHLHQRSAAG